MPETKNSPHLPPPLPPCRLYALLARKAPVGVIFRRGPSNWVQIIHWDTDKDIFTPGQWFHGRIYERRSDLSPDGKLLIYFAMNLKTRNLYTDYTYAWTALSKPPYLTALALWPKGSCWAGGGLFPSETEVWLNHREGEEECHPDHRPQGLVVTHDGGGMGEDDPILLRRLSRDGWRHAQEWQIEYTRTTEGFVTYAPRIQRKQNPRGWQKMTLTTSITGFTRRDDYSVRYAEGADQVLEGAEWADWDRQGRLVYALNGRIFAQAAELIGQQPARELIDLNGNTFEPLEAPEWAKRW